MKINIILPFFPRDPGGGSKIMYEYANRLAEIGYNVMVYSTLTTPYLHYSPLNPFPVRKLVSLLRDKNFPKPTWFTFHDNIQFSFINRICNKTVRNANATITTWWALVEPLSLLDNLKGKKINIIQGYEIWEGNKELVDQSFQFKNVINIAISHYVYNIVKKFDSETILIPNAIDNNVFYFKNSISQRPARSILMLYSAQKLKASDIGLKAILKLKKKLPDILVTFYGVAPRDRKIPLWINYLRTPSDLTLLYNQNRIFVSNSITEGWGLPLHEAMQCGCAVICTSIDGHEQFIKANEHIMTYEAGNDEDLYQKLLFICCLEDKSLELISEGNLHQVKQFSWEESINQLDSLLKN